MILLLDNYDSFTHNLADYLLQLGAEVVVLRPQQLTAIQWLQAWQGVVLSPGPGLPQDPFDRYGKLADGAPINLVEAVGYFALRSVPLLGICLGHQAIGQWAGAKLRKGEQPVHGKRYALQHEGAGLFDGLPSPLQIVRYHSWLLVHDAHWPSQLVCDAWCEECSQAPPTDQRPLKPAEGGAVMAIRHILLPIWGLQYHPEAALTSHGQQVLYTWLRATSRLSAKQLVKGASEAELTPSLTPFAALAPGYLVPEWLQMP